MPDSARLNEPGVLEIAMTPSMHLRPLETPRNLAALEGYLNQFDRDPNCSLLAKVAAAIKAIDDFDRREDKVSETSSDAAKLKSTKINQRGRERSDL
jgi:hypothetical protein